jgi:2-polyprenyl-3-methyl-5-hydroxy-6-metoxy-1,4-benzoquinol methylase
MTITRTPAPPSRPDPLRVLVVIASYGEKNLSFLRQIAADYQAMDFAVDVVVVSEAPKTVPEGVRVVVGLPAKNPWSLPFAHKAIFAENVARYDLFIYSEDDIGLTQANIHAFLGATDILAADEIAGFLRYETGPDGQAWMPDAHDVFHWKPESVTRRGGRIFAEYSNEHAACYMLTRSHLERAIASGGFLVAPYEGKYDMLCAAATDVYTRCGFRKLVGVSDLPDFLVHHLSNRYAGLIGLPLAAFEEQLDTLKRIGAGTHPATTLCEVESQLPRTELCKSFYETPEATLLAMVPAAARTVLSIGCGWGATEAALADRGMKVTAMPLDSVIGAAAEKLGVEAVYGRLDECFRALAGREYDCVIVTNLLHLQQVPEALFTRCAGLVSPGGTLVVDSPNFSQVAVMAKRALGLAGYGKLRSFAEGGVTVLNPRTLLRWSRNNGLSNGEFNWHHHSWPRAAGLSRLPLRMGRWTAAGLVFRARREAA